MFSELKKDDIIICKMSKGSIEEDWFDGREFKFTGELEDGYYLCTFVNKYGNPDKVKINDKELVKHFDWRNKRIDMLIY